VGKAGEHVDQEAIRARQERALKLLTLGYSQSLVAKSVGMSRSWVQQLAAERLPDRPSVPRVRA
jgi:transposase